MRLLPLLLLLTVHSVYAQPKQKDISRVLDAINKIRANGQQCGETHMVPTKPLEWDAEMYAISNKYVKYMAKNNHFDHLSLEGEDLGDRLDQAGYQWTNIGENLAMGYTNFFDALEAWKESPSHCKMLMNPDMTHVSISKSKKYWVQNFSRRADAFASMD